MKGISRKLLLDFFLFCSKVYRFTCFFGLMIMQQLEHNHRPNYSTLDLVLIVKRLEEVVGRIKEKREVRISKFLCEANDHQTIVLVGIDSCCNTGASQEKHIF